jgi:glyoxylase-like metal-dependent hydrolase (beta-lactamase superfamily II)
MTFVVAGADKRWPGRARRAACLLLAIALGALAPWARADEPPAMVAQQVSASAWYVQGLAALGSSANQNFISNAGFVITPKGVVVIDALGSPALAKRLIALIARMTPQPITTVILTHYHADHIYGLQAFQAIGAHIIAHRAALQYLNSDTARLRLQASRRDVAPWIDAGTRLVPADEWLDGEKDLVVGGVHFLIKPMGPAHTPEDLAIYVPSEKVLFAGDVVFRDRVPYVGEADSRHWIAALDTLLGMDIKVIVPGHGPRSTEPRKDLQLTRDYLVYLSETMGRAARNMDSFDEAYQATDWSRFEQLPLFHAANRMNAYNTFLLMEHESH